MLRFVETPHRGIRLEYLKNLNPAHETWVLSDLRTKIEIQNFFLDQKGHFSDESLLRASDLWKKILFRYRPEIRVLNTAAARLHLRVFLRKHAQSLGLHEGSDAVLMKWMNDLAPVYFHPTGFEKMEEWFESHPDEQNSWKDWWLRSRAAFAYFEDQSLLISQWIPSYLQSARTLSSFWDRDLIIDLGGQLSFVEAGLLQGLSAHRDVTVLAPHLLGGKTQDFRLRPYEELKGFAKDIRKSESPQVLKKTSTYRFSSSLGSLREATAQVRKWIEAGIPPGQIALMAPQVESLWPVLKLHFEREGIPFNRDTVVPLQSLSDVQNYLATLRTLGKGLSTRDLELCYFSETSQVELGFEKFESLFKNLYDPQDYGRHQSVKSIFKSDFQVHQPLTQDEILVRLIQIWNQTDLPFWLETLLREILSSFDSQMTLPWNEWILFCESIFAKKEVVDQPGDASGIQVTNLISAHFLKSEHRIFLELSDERLKESGRRGLSSQSSRQLARDLGFWLENSDQSALEFELQWLLQESNAEDHLHFSQSLMTGELQTPTPLWVQLSKGHEDVHQPSWTRMDKRLEQVPLRVWQDVGQKSLFAFPFTGQRSMSPNSVDDFLKCPFIFFAKLGLKLKSYPEVDLDQDPREAGQVYHRLFETLLSQELSSWTDSQIQVVLEKLRLEFYPFREDLFWGPEKIKLEKLTKRFLEIEVQWKLKFPEIKRQALEVKWKMEFEGLMMGGRIDRVDQASTGELILIDYKNSKPKASNIKSWIEKNQWQMFFYMVALESGAIPDFQGEVIAAFYYVVKTLQRQLGFQLEGDWPGFHSSSKGLSTEEKKDFLELFQSRLRDVAKQIQSGRREPTPDDESTCQTCEWRSLCRAPHLN